MTFVTFDLVTLTKVGIFAIVMANTSTKLRITLTILVWKLNFWRTRHKRVAPTFIINFQQSCKRVLKFLCMYQGSMKFSIRNLCHRYLDHNLQSYDLWPSKLNMDDTQHILPHTCITGDANVMERKHFSDHISCFTPTTIIYMYVSCPTPSPREWVSSKLVAYMHY